MIVDVNPDGLEWSKLSTGERIRSLEVEGFVVLPSVLNTETLAALKRQTRDWDPTAVDYSVHQRTMSDVQFAGGAVTSLIAHDPVIEFLRAAMGPDLVFMNAHFAISSPGHPGMNLHTDSHPYGHVDWGYSFSAPRQVRALYYLDELTPEVAPLRVVPRSHLSMHPDANPYKRYPSHPDEIRISAPAGTAVVINLALFHANGPNTGDRSREMIAMSYRPAWCGPTVPDVDAWPADVLAGLSEETRALCGDRNQRIAPAAAGGATNKPQQTSPVDSRTDAAGISPRRWARA